MNHSKLNQLFSILFLVLSFSLSAQKGTLRGSIIDDKTGQPIMFAGVLVVELTTGTETDLDGKYSIDLTPGQYTISVSYLGYNELKISDVIIEAGKVNLMDLRMLESAQEIKEVVITATQARSTEAALSTIKMKSINLLDGISSQSIKKTGDSSAGEALKRVTGVSVEGGKYVVVRGLGDRYTKTILNGLEIPGLDPDRNSVQMDIFPANIIDNILVYKTFSPNLPGDFTGGAVDIVTKDFPETKTFSASISLGFNPDMHFKSNFLGYEGGETDFLGFDDGTRALPFYRKTQIPSIAANSPALEIITKSFSKNLSAREVGNNLNKSISLASGNQYKVGGGTLGYILSLNYANRFTHYDNNIEYNEYYREADGNGYFIDRSSKGTVSEADVQWSVLAGTSYKYKNHKLSIEALRIQNGESKAAKINAQNYEINVSDIRRDNLEYAQREITNINISGKHTLGESGKWNIDWKFAPTFVKVDEPDMRTAGFDYLGSEEPMIRPSVGAEVTRFYRYLDENSYTGKFDLTYNLKINGKDSKIKAGIYALSKKRDFEVLNYQIRVNDQSKLSIKGVADNILKDENIWSLYNDNGAYIIGNYEPANTFSASQNIMAGYLMNELAITKAFKATYGVRVEKAENRYTGQNNAGNIVYRDQKVLDELSVLPSVNLVYEVADRSNIRLSFNKTVARPTFKENSIAQIQDRISNRTFLGNIGLKQSNINNIDLRFEKFFMGGELFSASIFFKQFFDPIQLVVYDSIAPNNFQPKNLDDTNVYGFEVETSKRLSFISASLSNFMVGANFTMVRSQNPLIGLSPFIVNINASFANESGWETNLTYNVQGKRLSVVGIARIEDVYENQFHSMNARVSKAFGIAKKYNVSLTIDNILKSKRLRLYDTKNGENLVFDRFEPGRTFTVSFGYSLK